MQLRNVGQYQEDRTKVRAEEVRKGRRDANINVLKPTPFHKPSMDIAKVSSNNIAVKKAHHIIMDSGDVIDSAISRMLRSDRSSGKEHLLPC